MKFIGNKVAIVAFLIVTALFFYKTFVSGLIPFPGDVLLAEYKPWQTYSYNDYVPGSIPHKAQYFDTLRQMYPWRTLTDTIVKSGQLPLWNPHNFAGSPLLANHQSAILYPLNLVYLMFPQPIAWTILIVLQPLLASIFMYLYARRIMLSPAGAILSSITFGFSLYIATFLEYNVMGHVILWLPLGLYAIEGLRERINNKDTLILIVSILFSLLAGHLQLFAAVLGVLLVYAVVRAVSQRIRFTLVAFMVLALGIGAVQLLPTVELISLSARAPHDLSVLLDRLLLQPVRLVRLMAPDTFGNPATHNYLLDDAYPGKAGYIGLVSLILAAVAIWNKRDDWRVRFFGVTATAVLALTIRNPISSLLYSLNIPFVSTSSPGNMLFLLSLAGGLLAGIGLDAWQESKKTLIKPVALHAGMFLLLAGVAYVLIGDINQKNLIFSAGILGLSAILVAFGPRFKKSRPFIMVLLLLLLVGDLFFFFRKFNPFVPRSFIFPEAPILAWLQDNTTLDRFMGIGSATVEANYATQYSLYSPDGYDPLYPALYGQLIASVETGTIPESFTLANRSDAKLVYHTDTQELQSRSQRLMNLLGVKYVLDRTENASTIATFPEGIYEQVHREDDWIVQQNLKALPRAFITNQYESFSNSQEFENMFYDPSFDPGQTILLEEDIELPATPLEETEQATIVSYTPNEVIIETQTSDERLLFLSDTWYPGWKAYIDGEETPIYRAHYAFRAILVPDGAHSITFKYEPSSITTGLNISIISMFGFLGLVVLRKRYE